MDNIDDLLKDLYSKEPRKRRKKKYRSIDDPWEDSSEFKPFKKPTIKSFKPVERYYYNAVIRDQSGSMGEAKLFSVGPTLHKKIMEAMIGTGQMQSMSTVDPVSGNEGAHPVRRDGPSSSER
jgi:hypothetical protein